MTLDQSEELQQVNKGIEACGNLLSFLHPDKVGLLEDFLAHKARQFWNEAALAPTWDKVLENRSVAAYLAGPLSDLRGLVEAHREELEQIKASIENPDDL